MGRHPRVGLVEMQYRPSFTAFFATMICVGAAAAPVFTPKPCPEQLKGTNARCGSVEVLENPAAANSRKIAINVIVAPALHPQTGAPAMFHFEGGPGIAGSDAAGFYAGPGSAYRETRDVVAFDQRGTGHSNPLRCPATETRSPLVDEYVASDLKACREALAKIADLGSYSTERAADDVDQIREALGYPKIDIWSLSYGTRLAQVYIKRHGDRVNRVVMVGFVPLDYRTPLTHAANSQRVLDMLFFKCQTEPACNAKYPNLRAEWKTMLDALPRAGLPRGPFTETFRSMMGTAAGQRTLPSIIHAAASGDFQPFLKQVGKDHSQFAEGLYLTIACSEGGSRIKPEDIDRYTTGTFLGDYRVREELAACALWPKYKPDESFYEEPRAAPPILMLSGEMDYVAAPDLASAFCSTLSNCRFIEVPDMGHAPFDLDAWENGSCFDDMAIAFFKDPNADLSCIKRLHPPKFK